MQLKKLSRTILLTLILGVMWLGGTALAANTIELYTPYTSLSVTPGQSINYSIEMINQTQTMQTVGLGVEGLPANWEYELKSGSWEIQELSVKAEETRNLNLTVNVPLEVDKGQYNFRVVTDRGAILPIRVNVTEQGTFKTEFTVDQPNMEGSSDASFTYSAVLKNKTADEQTYALRHGAPRGWEVQFKVAGKSVTSVVLEPDSTENITIEMTPSHEAPADTYQIPVEVTSGTTTEQLTLEAVVTGTYRLNLSTPTGLLSTDITAGNEKNIELVVKNNGTSDLNDIVLSAQTPIDWEVTFDTKEIDHLAAGESKNITATLKASNKAIAGDYLTTITARAPEASDTADFRIAVKASVLWGWLGILIIVFVFVSLYYLFRKYGRR